MARATVMAKVATVMAAAVTPEEKNAPNELTRRSLIVLIKSSGIRQHWRLRKKWYSSSRVLAI